MTLLPERSTTDADVNLSARTGWTRLPLKRLGRFSGGAGFPHDEQGHATEEIPFFKVGDLAKQGNELVLTKWEHSVSVSTAKRLSATIFPPETVVFAKVGAALLLNRRRQIGIPACVDNNMMGFIPTGCVSRWALYWLLTVDLGQLSNPGAVPSVNEGQMKTLWAAVPPLIEQRAIAAFLDRETARIDDLVQKKERLIELLAEKRTALITQAVTKGLDPTVPMKDSGVEWLGEVPAHWEVQPMKRLLSAGLAYGVLKPDKYDGDDAVPLVRTLDIDGRTIKVDQLERISPAQHSEYARTQVADGDLLISVVGTIGKVAFVPLALNGANLSRALARVQIKDRHLAEYVAYVFDSDLLRTFVEITCEGTAQKVLNLGDLAAFPMALPSSRPELEAISAAIDRETVRIDALVAKVHEAIDRLREYRTALISAAVTGKIDVRDAA